MSCLCITRCVCVFLDINSIETTPGIDPSHNCSDGFSAYWYGCYKFETNATSWLGAEQHCQSLGGNLASIHDPAENAYIYSVARDEWPLWIGLQNVILYDKLFILYKINGYCTNEIGIA